MIMAQVLALVDKVGEVHAETHSETFANVEAELQGDTLVIMHEKRGRRIISQITGRCGGRATREAETLGNTSSDVVAEALVQGQETFDTVAEV